MPLSDLLSSLIPPPPGQVSSRELALLQAVPFNPLHTPPPRFFSGWSVNLRWVPLFYRPPSPPFLREFLFFSLFYSSSIPRASSISFSYCNHLSRPFAWPFFYPPFLFPTHRRSTPLFFFPKTFKQQTLFPDGLASSPLGSVHRAYSLFHFLFLPPPFFSPPSVSMKFYFLRKYPHSRCLFLPQPSILPR